MDRRASKGRGQGGGRGMGGGRGKGISGPWFQQLTADLLPTIAHAHDRERLIATSGPPQEGGLNPQRPPQQLESKCQSSLFCASHTLSRLPRWLWSASLRISADGGGRLKSASLRISKEALRRRCCGFGGLG